MGYKEDTEEERMLMATRAWAAKADAAQLALKVTELEAENRYLTEQVASLRTQVAHLQSHAWRNTRGRYR